MLFYCEKVVILLSTLKYLLTENMKDMNMTREIFEEAKSEKPYSILHWDVGKRLSYKDVWMGEEGEEGESLFWQLKQVSKPYKYYEVKITEGLRLHFPWSYWSVFH